MRIALFGVTGRTGQLFASQALHEGHRVTAMARSPEKLMLHSERLTVIQGDARSEESVNQVVAGTEAAVSLLGPRKDLPPYSVSQATDCIIRAMHQHNIRRLVVVAGAGVGDPEDRPRLSDRIITSLIKMVTRDAYEDMLRTASLVRGSNLDWTLVRVPMLTNNPASGQIKVGYLGSETGTRISRADLAAFILREVKTDSSVGKAPVISN